MADTEKKKPTQVDILGQPLEVGNYAAVGKGNQLFIGKIVKVTPKMMRVKGFGSNAPYQSRSDEGCLVYSNNTILLSGEDTITYILKYGQLGK